MSTQIVPSVGAGLLFSQGGIGASPGYAAIDDRRSDAVAVAQGIINAGAYLVTQRGAGANQSVDIAASAGTACIAGTTIGNQGVYTVPPHSAVINEVIAAADPTNPRIDQVILRAYDNTIDGSGNNFARTEVLTGTPTVGATLVNRTGAAALSANAIRLADVLVPAASASVTNANIKDRRPRTRGKSIIATTEARTNVAFGLMPTPDQVNELVVPTDAVICVLAQMTWQESVAGAASAALLIGANQLSTVGVTGGSPITATGVGVTSGQPANIDEALSTWPGGLRGQTSRSGGAYTGDVTTGQAIGLQAGATGVMSGICFLFVAAGTYDVGVQFKATSGSVTAKNRKLWVWTMDPAMAVLA